MRITPDGDGCRIGLRVVPGAKRDAIEGRFGERLRLRVRAAPEKGRANRAVVTLLADSLGIPAGRIEIVAGRASRDKIARISGLDPEELRSHLRDLS